MTILMDFDPKVKQFHISVTFDTFVELMLHHEMCPFSFSEILTLMKQGVECTWKAWRTKEVDWGPSPSIPNVPKQATTSLLAQGNKEVKSNTFSELDSDCRTAPDLNDLYNRIRTRIRACKYNPESSRSLLSNGSRLISKLHLSQQELTKQGVSVSAGQLGLLCISAQVRVVHASNKP